MRKEWTWIVTSCVLLVMVVSMLNTPRVDATPASKPLPAGSWWTNAGTYSWELSGTGHYSGKYREDGTYTEKYTVVSSSDSTMVISYSETGSWTCTAAGEWASTCQPNAGTYSSQTDYTIDIATLKVTGAYDASSPESIREEVGHPTWILLATDLTVGDSASQWWYVPNSDGTTSTITDVLWKVEKLQEINVKGVDVTVRILTYSGEHLGGFYRVSNGHEFDSKGVMTESDLYDTAYGILMGHTRTGVYTHADSEASAGSSLYSEGNWTETQQNSSQITDTNLEFEPPPPPQVSITLGSPMANVPVTVDGASYAGDQLPKVFVWDVGSTHTLRVDTMIEGESGVRYVFIQWSDGSKDTSRSITATESTNLAATFKTQYELKVISYLGDPQGSGWYDAGSTATFSVTSPQPETGLFGLLGGKTVFQAWTGDSQADTSTADIVMESPKTVQAQWITDDSQPYMILGGIGVGVVVVIILALLLMRRKKPPLAVYTSVQTPVPTPPPPPLHAAPTKFCRHCGAKIPHDSRFCEECGNRLV